MGKNQDISKFLIRAQEEERKKIARELHDEVGQTLTAIKINLEILKRKLPSDLIPYIEESISLIDKSIEQIRDISLNLRPSLLDNLGLKSALRWYIEKQKEKSGIDIEYILDFEEESFSSDHSIVIFRIIQESLTNIIRHSKAKRVLLNIKENDEELVINIIDDGIGIDVEGVWQEVKEGRALGNKSNITIKMKIKILMADDHALVREGIKALLKGVPEIKVVGEARDGDEVINTLRELKPDILLLDISMPKVENLSFCNKIKLVFENTKIIILSMHYSEEYIKEALRYGVKGYVLKDSSFSELEVAIKSVFNGEIYLTPKISRILVEDYIKKIEDPLATLSERQKNLD